MLVELVLGSTVDHAVRGFRRLVLNHVVHDDVRGLLDASAQDHVEPLLERRTPHTIPSHLNVFDEELDQGVGIAHVDRQRIAGRELPDGLDRLEALDSACELRRHRGSLCSADCPRQASAEPFALF